MDKGYDNRMKDIMKSLKWSVSIAVITLVLAALFFSDVQYFVKWPWLGIRDADCPSHCDFGRHF